MRDFQVMFSNVQSDGLRENEMIFFFTVQLCAKHNKTINYL